MILVLSVWAIVVLTSLWRGVLPDAITWGVPGGFWFLMNPALPKRGGTPPAATEDGQAP
jgi:hypothetical protein